MNAYCWLDRVGGVAGVVCAVHCALVGLAFGMLASSSFAFVTSPGFDLLFVVIAVAVGALAAATGWRRHGSWKPAAIFAVSLGILLIAKFGLHHDHGPKADALDQIAPAILSVIGGAGLVWFHVLNSRLRVPCPHCGGTCGVELADAPEVGSKTTV